MHGLFRRRRLPHWDVADGTYFVTACLAGSIPSTGRLDTTNYRKSLDARRPAPHLSPPEWELQKEKLVFARLDAWMDERPAVRHFDSTELAATVRQSIYHFAEVRYRVLAYVIMPSHIHWLFHPLEQPAGHAKCTTAGMRSRSPRESIMHSFKSYTANHGNRLLGLSGAFWQQESYDHWVRDVDELMRIIAYIEQNPVKAGIVANAADYVFSSAFDRKLWGISPGEALVAPP